VNFSAIFIRRPVATTLLTIGLALAGLFAYFKLPVAPLPQVDFPTIVVSATMPGASPDTMATTVATPLERHLGVIADVTEMTSTSTVGNSRITLQFNLSRNIDGAARDVEAAINAARADLPTSLRQNPTYRKVNPADAPIAILSMTSDTLTRGQIYDAASTVMQQALSQIDGIGQVTISGSSLPAVRVELNPQALFKYGIGLEDVRAALASANAHSPKGALDQGDRRYQIYTNDQANHAADYKPLIIAYRNGAAVHLTDVAEVKDSVENVRNQGLSNGKPAVLVILYRQPGANIIDTVDRVNDGSDHDDPRVAARCRARAVGRDRARNPRRLCVFTQRPTDVDPERRGAGFADRHLWCDVAVGLQPRQFIADGVDYFDRVRRRRCDRRPRKHHAPYRSRDDADGSRSFGLARSRLYRRLDELVADRGVHADPVDGWYRRPAVPRIRGNLVNSDPDLADRVADGNADDVRPSAGE
jgi:hypothetical protein